MIKMFKKEIKHVPKFDRLYILCCCCLYMCHYDRYYIYIGPTTYREYQKGFPIRVKST